MSTKEDFSFEISFYENLDRRDKLDARVIELLAQLYTREGRIEDGLSMDLRLSQLRPEDPLVHYNLSCSLALIGQVEEALTVLKQSIEMGYSDFKWMLEDPDLDSVRKLGEFQAFLEHLRSNRDLD